MDPVIIVGAGPVGLALALALARQEVPSVVLDEGPGNDEQRPARTVVLREDTAALMERLTGLPLDEAGFRWAGWRSMRRKQVMSEITFDADGSGGSVYGSAGVAYGSGGAGYGSAGAAGVSDRSMGGSRRPVDDSRGPSAAPRGPRATTGGPWAAPGGPWSALGVPLKALKGPPRCTSPSTC
uniref:FAD-binding domain-containing protein n=1 Tax=Streptomyces avermitilis TaxID=33903 RepID=A0A499V7M3_STRAX|nr:hypothetical protein SAVMC3_29130 [Streptomyces avermitilis]